MSSKPRNSRRRSLVTSPPDIGCIVLGSADLDTNTAASVLDRFHAAGGRKLDLANVYGDGASSRAVGAWLRTARAREEMTLYAKGCHPPYCAPSLVKQEVDRARALLGVEVLDVFILHRDDLTVTADAWAEALLAEVDGESVRSLGVSNWTLPRFRQLRSSLGTAADKLTLFSNHFSLAEMVTPTWPGCLAMTRDEVSVLTATGTTSLAWASVAGGYFAGRNIPSWHSTDNAARRERAGNLGKQLDVSPAAIALAYVLHQPGRMLAAVGTRSPMHLDELLAATKLQLTAGQLSWLEHG